MTCLQVDKYPRFSMLSESEGDKLQKSTDFRVVIIGSGVLSQVVARQLSILFPNIMMESALGHISNQVMEASILGADLVLDGSGNDNDRYMINRICLKMGIPWVYSAIRDGYGLLMTIIPGRTPCFECLMGQPGDLFQPQPATLAAGIVPMVASLQVSQAYHLLLNDSQWLHGLIYVDAWTSHYETIEIKGKKCICPACGFGR